MDIIIPTCNLYLPVVEANLHSIDYFWKDRDDIIILGYDFPKFSLPQGSKFISLGVDETPERWSDGLLKFFESYGQKNFLLHMDDHCLVAPVDTEKIKKVEKIMSDDESINKVMLHPFFCQYPTEKYESEYDDLKLFICENNYGSTTLMPAIWKTSYIKSLLNKGLSAHSFERQADNGPITNKTLSTHNEILMVSSLVNRGVRNKNWHICWHRSEFVFPSPNEEYVSSINKIIDTTRFNS